jgi:hypothetical protein
MTKTLLPSKFHHFVSKLGMINIYHGQACGRLLNDQIDNTKQLEKELTKYMEKEHNKSGFLRSQATKASSAIS